MGKRLLLRVLDGETDITSPYHPEGKIKYQYVMVDEKDRMGYLLIWCDYTLNGINISRVGIPHNASYIKIEDRENSNVPKIINFKDLDPKIW